MLEREIANNANRSVLISRPRLVLVNHPMGSKDGSETRILADVMKHMLKPLPFR